MAKKKTTIPKSFGWYLLITTEQWKMLKKKKWDVDILIQVGNKRVELTFKELEKMLK